MQKFVVKVDPTNDPKWLVVKKGGGKEEIAGSYKKRSEARAAAKYYNEGTHAAKVTIL